MSEWLGLVPEAIRDEVAALLPTVELDEAEPRLPDPSRNQRGPAHRYGTDTERRAATLVAPTSGTKRGEVLDFVAARGDYGATDEEISIGTGMRLYTAAPRRGELLRDGWVRDSGRRRETSTRTRAIVWVLTDQGRQERGTP